MMDFVVKSSKADTDIKDIKISGENKNLNCAVDRNILKDEDKYKNGRKQRSTTIIGDSTLKDNEPRKMREAMGKSKKVINHFQVQTQTQWNTMRNPRLSTKTT